jgi:hypothetical protein
MAAAVLLRIRLVLFRRWQASGDSGNAASALNGLLANLNNLDDDDGDQGKAGFFGRIEAGYDYQLSPQFLIGINAGFSFGKTEISGSGEGAGGGEAFYNDNQISDIIFLGGGGGGGGEVDADVELGNSWSLAHEPVSSLWTTCCSSSRVVTHRSMQTFLPLSVGARIGGRGILARRWFGRGLEYRQWALGVA